MDNPFDSPRMLIQEAEENIARIEKLVETFLGHESRTGGVEKNPKTGEQLLYVQFAEPIPAKISLLIRAAARDLRDALDHAVYASSVTLEGGEPKYTKFLSADGEEGITNDIKRGRCKDVHKDIIAFMVEEAAHKAGNRTLWTLNHFRNHNTHKVVSLANASAQGFGINNGGGSFNVSTMSEWRTTSRRLYFARMTPESQFNMQVSPAVEIRLHHSFAAGEISASAFLRKATAEAARITDAIESKTQNLIG